MPLAVLGHVSPCDVFVRDCKKKGYERQVLVVDHEAFVKCSRARVLVLGCGPEAGAMAGAIDARDAVLKVMQTIERLGGLSGVPSIFDIGVDPKSLQEQRRRRDDSATC